MRSLLVLAAIAVLTCPAAAQTFWEIDGQLADQLVKFTVRDVAVVKARRNQEADTQDIAHKVFVPGLPWYPATARVSWNLPDPVLQWINDSRRLMRGRHIRSWEQSSRGGAAIELQDAYLDSVEFPGGDLALKKFDPSPKNYPGMNLRAKGIVVGKPATGGAGSQKTWNPANFKFTLRDGESNPVDVVVQRFLPIKFHVTRDSDDDGSPDQAFVSIDDIVLTVPGESYGYFAEWFAKVLAVAPLLDPIDNGDYLKRSMELSYLLDDGSAVVLRLKGVMPLSAGPSGSSFEVILGAEQIVCGKTDHF